MYVFKAFFYEWCRVACSTWSRTFCSARSVSSFISYLSCFVSSNTSASNLQQTNPVELTLSCLEPIGSLLLLSGTNSTILWKEAILSIHTKLSSFVQIKQFFWVQKPHEVTTFCITVLIQVFIIQYLHVHISYVYQLVVVTYNRFHNILRLFDVLPNLSFTTSEAICDYYL